MADHHHHHKHEGNVLVEKLGQAYHGLREGPSRTTLWLVGLGVLAVVLVLAWRYFASSSREATSARWFRLDQSVFPTQLEAAVQDRDYAGTTPGRLARFREARLLMSEGLRDIGKKSPTALEKVGKATELYEALVKEAIPVPALHDEALLGAARGNEALGKLDQARELYNRLATAKDRAGSHFAKDAEAQLKRLDDEENKKELQRVLDEYRPKNTETE